MKYYFLVSSLLLIIGCTLPFGLNAIPEESFRVKVSWLGHAGFMIESGSSRIYINPYSAPVGSLKGDGILVSYSGSDICDLNSISDLRKDDSIIVAPPECVARLAMGDVQTLIIDANYSINGFVIETLDAYTINGTISEGEGAGFILNVNNTRIYYAGITDIIPEMSNVSDIDVLIFPIAGGKLTMSMIEALDFIEMIDAEHNIPMYYGGNTGTSLDVGRQMRSLAAGIGYNVTLLDNKDLLIK